MSRRIPFLGVGIAAFCGTLAVAAELGRQQRIAGVGPAATSVEIASGGPSGRHLVVWAGARNDEGSEVYGRVTDGRGRPRGPARRLSNLRTPDDRSSLLRPAAAYNASREEYVVVWAGAGESEASEPCQTPQGFPGPIPCTETDLEIYMRRVDAYGRPLGRQRRITSTGPHDCTRCQANYPRIAYDPQGDRYLVAFVAQPEPASPRIRTQLLRGDGTEARPGERGATKPANFGLGDLAYDRGDRTFVLLHATGGEIGRSEVQLTQLDATGKPVGRRRAISAGEGSVDSNPRIALTSNGRRMLAVWETGAVDQPEQAPVARALGDDGSPRGPVVPLTQGENGFNPQPAVAWDRATRRFAVVWSRLTDGDREIYATFANTQPTPPFSSPVRVSRMGPDRPPGTPDYVDYAYFPGLAARDQRGFLSAWYGYEEDEGGGGVYVRALR